MNSCLELAIDSGRFHIDNINIGLSRVQDAMHMDVNLSIWASQVPWWGKMAAKMFLTRLPVNYRAWKHMHLFELGAMEEPAYAYGVYKKHFDRTLSLKRLDNFVGLELGPGDSLLSAMVAYAFGASAYHLVDVGAYAQADLKPYQAMADFLVNQGLPAVNADDLTSIDAILRAYRATYGTQGLTSLRAIPDKSVNFIWSHSVLQHVRRAEFQDTLRELRRILRADGISSHLIDLQDCLGGALNNLRFRESIWESPFMSRSGFYTNRIRYSEMLALFKEGRFEPEVVHLMRWDRLPTPRSKLWDRFRDLPDDDLCVQLFQVILRPV